MNGERRALAFVTHQVDLGGLLSCPDNAWTFLISAYSSVCFFIIPYAGISIDARTVLGEQWR